MARLLVPAIKERDGVPTGCTGVTMEDGTVYRATRAGHMEVNDPGHIRAMERNGDGFIIAQSASTRGTAGTTCETCEFHGFRFHLEKPCPKCGGHMAPDVPKET